MSIAFSHLRRQHHPRIWWHHLTTLRLVPFQFDTSTWFERLVMIVMGMYPLDVQQCYGVSPYNHQRSSTKSSVVSFSIVYPPIIKTWLEDPWKSPHEWRLISWEMEACETCQQKLAELDTAQSVYNMYVYIYIYIHYMYMWIFDVCTSISP